MTVKPQVEDAVVQFKVSHEWQKLSSLPFIDLDTSTSGTLPPMEKNPASFDDALSQLAAPRFLLDLRASADNTAVSKWLSEPMPMHANIFDHLIVRPSGVNGLRLREVLGL
jgi:hypothetical protein